MAQNVYNTNPFSDYGYIEQQAWTGFKEQMAKEGFATEYHTEVGVGFVEGDASIENGVNDDEVTENNP